MQGRGAMMEIKNLSITPPPSNSSGAKPPWRLPRIRKGKIYLEYLGNTDQDVGSLNLDLVLYFIPDSHFHEGDLRLGNSLTCSDIELSTMPGTGDNVSRQNTIDQRTA